MSVEALRMQDDSTSFLTIFGPPGVGKTTALAQLAPKTLLLTSEHGWKVLRDNHPQLYARTVPMKFEGLTSFRDAIKAIKAEPDRSDWQLGVDTLSSMQQMKIEENMRNDKIDIKRKHEDIPALQDYLLSQKQWTPILNALTMCGVNVTVLCHHRVPQENPKPGETTRPALTDAVLQVVNGNSNVVAFMQKDSSGTKRRFSTLGTASLTAKDQTAVEARDIPYEVFLDRIRKTRGY